jgi:sulfide:quinone oxidoreductase
VLIAGGGIAALEAVLALRSLAGDRLSIELLAPEPRYWHRAHATAEPFGLAGARSFDLPALAARAGAVATLGALAAVDTERRIAITTAAAELPYDALLVACGAVPVPAVAGATTFRGPADVDRVEHLLAEIAAGAARRIVVAVPRGGGWTLPAYELALQTAAWAAERSLAAEIALVTHEPQPLALFGSAGVAAATALLRERGVALRVAVEPASFDGERLLLAPDGAVPADRVLATPDVVGPGIAGLPQSADGFVPVDPFGRVPGARHVFAAGDVTTFPIKQGGIAAQMADAAAASIAALVGAKVPRRPFRPVLRGLLLNGSHPRYVHRDLAAGAADRSWEGVGALWWPPAKVAGRHVAAFLAALGLDVPGAPGDASVAARVELPLDQVPLPPVPVGLGL